MSSIKVMAPAKVNLFLGIGPTRQDGFHEVNTVMHALLMHDTITLKLYPGKIGVPRDCEPATNYLFIGVQCHVHDSVDDLDIPQEENIVFKAAQALAIALDRRVGEYLSIKIDKFIPHGAGLGGGSSDAAATLIALCSMWDVDPEDERVIKVAHDLGADVAFFLKGGCARMGGKGEIFEESLQASKSCVILVKPKKAVSTSKAYKTFDQNPIALGSESVEALKQIKSADEVELFNNLAPAAESLMPELAEIRTWLEQQEGISKDAQGKPQVLLCGSGSTTFALCDFSVAGALRDEAQRKGWWSRVTGLADVRAEAIHTIL